MTQRAGRSPAPVATASPTGRPSGYAVRRSSRHSASSRGPAARWMAPSTPPPPSRELLAALTIASTRSVVMSPSTASREALWRSMFGTVVPPADYLPRSPPTCQDQRHEPDHQGSRGTLRRHSITDGGGECLLSLGGQVHVSDLGRLAVILAGSRPAGLRFRTWTAIELPLRLSKATS